VKLVGPQEREVAHLSIKWRIVRRVVVAILLLTAAFILINALIGSTGTTHVG
jgi:hypothetical protein